MTGKVKGLSKYYIINDSGLGFRNGSSCFLFTIEEGIINRYIHEAGSVPRPVLIGGKHVYVLGLTSTFKLL